MTVLIDAKRGDYIISQFLLNGYLTDGKLTDEMLYPLGASIGGLCDWISTLILERSLILQLRFG